jgi:hypothetical protein
VVDLAHARTAVVGTAGGERRGMEGVDELAPVDPEGDVNAGLRSAVALRDPEEGDVVSESADLGDGLHHQP